MTLQGVPDGTGAVFSNAVSFFVIIVSALVIPVPMYSQLSSQLSFKMCTKSCHFFAQNLVTVSHLSVMVKVLGR